MGRDEIGFSHGAHCLAYYAALFLRSRLHKNQRLEHPPSFLDSSRLFAAHVISLGLTVYFLIHTVVHDRCFISSLSAIRALCLIIWLLGDCVANLSRRRSSHWKGFAESKIAVYFAHFAVIGLRIVTGIWDLKKRRFQIGLVVLKDILADLVILIKEIKFWNMRRRKDLVYNVDWTEPTEEELERDNICLICRSEITDVKDGGKLHCGHYFHRECLVPWFRKRSHCPYCAADGHVEGR
jgi:hypothetical protein